MENRTPRRRVRDAIRDFLATESSGGAPLLVAALAALLWANLWPGTYEGFWSAEVDLSLGPFALPHEVRAWVTEGLMAIFFFVVGLEIKRELLTGELRGWRNAALPVAAAAGGMLLPAAIYLAINYSGEAARGWGIPMATDIAFAVGILTLLGDRISHQMKVLLLGIAIADDIGAVIVIAIFYSTTVHVGYLAAALAVAAFAGAVTRIELRSLRWVLFGAGSIASWLFMLDSGVHASMAGVLVAAALPLERAERTTEVLQRRLHRFSSLAVLPLFALAAAGVVFSRSAFEALGSGIALGVIAGLVIGKPLGISLFAALALRLGLARPPSGITARHFLALGAVAGVGFTVSLFVSELAFADSLLADRARLATLVASTLAAALGIVVCVLACRTRPR
ncbi:MAG: Na+/H+ antiporter NhaA [Actinomycetota bacterium]